MPLKPCGAKNPHRKYPNYGIVGCSLIRTFAKRLSYGQTINPMRSATQHLLISMLIFVSVLSTNTLFSQYYIDASANLPDNGASSQSKDLLVIDIDTDGDMDVILANEFQNNVILINDGQGVFSRGNVGIPVTEEHDSEAIAVGDFSQDGSIDIVFVSEDDFEHEYYWNNGNGTFETPPLFLPLTNCRAALAEDFNNDGVADLMLGNNGFNMMLINNGQGEFINESFDRLPFIEDLTQDLAANDVDGDGDLDIFVANEDGNRLLINNGAGIFSDASAARLPQGLNIDSRTVLFEDVDMDNDLDIYLCNVEFSPGKDAKNRLFLNDSNGFFTDVTEAYLPAIHDQSLDATFTDFDFDGDQDLLVANVLGIPVFAYSNDGTGKFADVTSVVFNSSTVVIEAFGMAKADFNNDGFEDIYICNQDGKDKLLLRNPDVVSTDEIVIPNARIFPNPPTNFFYLEGNFDQPNLTYTLSDLSGTFNSTLRAVEIDHSRLRFSLPANLSSGIYFLTISNKKEKQSLPIFLSR